MMFAAEPLRQRDGVTCGPTVAVVAGALLDSGYGAALQNPATRQSWFAREQARLHSSVNRFWPRRLGMTPAGMARAISRWSAGRGVRYRYRWARGGRDPLADVAYAAAAGWPVPVLIGRGVPRHWVLVIGVTDEVLRCYEPTSGEVRTVPMDALRQGALAGLGFPRAFAFVLPSALTRSAPHRWRRRCGARPHPPRCAAGGPAPRPTAHRRTGPAGDR